jgi:hypothetical protein
MHRVCGGARSLFSVAAFATATFRCWCCRPTPTALVKGSRCVRARTHTIHTVSQHTRPGRRARTYFAIGVLYAVNQHCIQMYEEESQKSNQFHLSYHSKLSLESLLWSNCQSRTLLLLRRLFPYVSPNLAVAVMLCNETETCVAFLSSLSCVRQETNISDQQPCSKHLSVAS